MQNFNSEIVKSLDGLKERRDTVLMEMKREEDKKIEIERRIFQLQQEFDNLNGR